MSAMIAPKKMEDSSTYLAEIVGEENAPGQRMQAGAILDLMDSVAGRSAGMHSGSPVVTLSFDRVDLVHPLVHMDLVRLEGRVVQVGNSSMMVAVNVTRQDPFTRDFIPLQHSFVTMVAIDGKGRPNRNIPKLHVETPGEQALNSDALAHKEHTRKWVDMQEQARNRGALTVGEVEEPINREKREFVYPEETVVKVRRIFMPRHLNVHGTIFGGDILLWMDRMATYTARLFTRNRNMVTLSMNNIFFKQPILASDLVEMTARVVYVRHFTLEVDIAVTLQRGGGEEIASHSGYFTVLNYDESGFKRPIITGLRLDDGNQDGMMRYLLARERYHFWRTQQARSAKENEDASRLSP